METPYTLKRSKRRTVALEITREGNLLVRAPLWTPTRVIDGFVASRAGWVQKQLARQAARNAAHPLPDQAGLDLLKARARAYIPGRVEAYAALMGLKPTGVKITAARTRFGSCNPQNSLCFSCFLMEYPPEAIDYVVVHELAHIPHKNHGVAFYKTIQEVLPDYKARRALLKR